MDIEGFSRFLRDQDGNANVPCVNWNDAKLNRNANWLDNKWNKNDRVLLLDTFIFFTTRVTSGGGVFLVLLYLMKKILQNEIPSYKKFCSFQNLFSAWQEFKKRKQQKVDVAEFASDLIHNLSILESSLLSLNYKHGGYFHFKISDPKQRDIHKAINRFRDFSRKVSKNNTETCWVLKCDIKKFFANIDHQTLKNILAKHIKDKNIFWLLGRVMTFWGGCIFQNTEYLERALKEEC